jgi:hypothetical protein
MKPSAWLLCLLAAVSAPRPSPAQDRPDFSGTWSIAGASGDARRGGGAPLGRGARAGRGARGPQASDTGSGWGVEFTITQTAEKLTVERPLYARSDMQPPFRLHYALDGSTRANKLMVGRGIRELASTTSWDGEKLVIKTGFPFVNPTSGREEKSELTQTLSLTAAEGQDAPPVLVVEATRSGVLGGPPSVSRATYTRRGSR